MRTGKGEKTGVPGKNVFQKLKRKMISTEKLAAEAGGGGAQGSASLPGEDPTRAIFCVSRAGSGQVSPS